MSWTDFSVLSRRSHERRTSVIQQPIFVLIDLVTGRSARSATDSHRIGAPEFIADVDDVVQLIGCRDAAATVRRTSKPASTRRLLSSSVGPMTCRICLTRDSGNGVALASVVNLLAPVHKCLRNGQQTSRASQRSVFARCEVSNTREVGRVVRHDSSPSGWYSGEVVAQYVDVSEMAEPSSLHGARHGVLLIFFFFHQLGSRS